MADRAQNTTILNPTVKFCAASRRTSRHLYKSMSAFGGKADMASHREMSANDPKRTWRSAHAPKFP